MSDAEEQEPTISFKELGLSDSVLTALDAVGYEKPSPIQAATIPIVLEGKDVVGQAQTGTGKTAAFALPLLSRIDLERSEPQVLVLAPTRELAIQVSEAFRTYASGLRGFRVLPIYGGQGYETQLRQLKRGIHVVVGTPGRVMDHMRRGTLDLSKLNCLVLDEADEMLRMGFIDDVEWVLQQTPPERQIALFSATMPDAIRRIAKTHLKDPEEVTVTPRTVTAETINQRYLVLSGPQKLQGLTRVLEAETFDGMIVFVRTKTATVELAEKLEARGFACSPLNGDIAQNQRERTVEKLKSGAIDILVATDVAARGLDVQRISHVINYDIPYDAEAYVHRVGRTGRMSRTGEAILFVTPRERRLLQTIERATNRKVTAMTLPSTELINTKRIARFKQKITDTLDSEDLGIYHRLIEDFQQEHDVPAAAIAAALARMFQGDTPLLLEDMIRKQGWDERPGGGGKKKPFSKSGKPSAGMERYRIEVGRVHGVQPGNIVGAVANEAGLESEFIGRIKIYDNFSTIDLPEGMPPNTMRHLRKVRVSGQVMDIKPDTFAGKPGRREGRESAHPAGFQKRKKEFGGKKGK